MQPTLSFVIVEYNSIGDIAHCVDSIRQHVSQPHEIIVSSNSCYDKQKQEEICKQQGYAKWLFNDRNGGFAYAMNEGLKKATGAYLIIMNSDCILETDLSNMVAFMEEHPHVGAIAPQMRDSNGNIQDTARPYVSVPRYILRQVKRIVGHKISILDNRMDYGAIQTVDWLIGAFIMVSRKAYEATKGLDANYFMYAEDLDWCTRIRQKGLEVVYFPHATICYQGTRRARSNAQYAKIFIKSHIRYWKKFGFFYGYPKRIHETF